MEVKRTPKLPAYPFPEQCLYRSLVWDGVSPHHGYHQNDVSNSRAFKHLKENERANNFYRGDVASLPSLALILKCAHYGLGAINPLSELQPEGLLFSRRSEADFDLENARV